MFPIKDVVNNRDQHNSKVEKMRNCHGFELLYFGEYLFRYIRAF